MARVIRGPGAAVVPAEVLEAKEAAARIVAEAETRAAQILERERAALEAAAREEAKAELAARHVAFEAERASALVAIEDRVAELAVAVAARVLGDAFEADPRLVRGRVEEALARVRRAAQVRVRAHPDDLAALEGIAAERIADPSVSRGGCVVTSELGEVDGRIEVALDALARALEDARR